MSTPENMAMAQSIAIPEPGVPEAQWMRVGPAYVVNLRAENAKLRESLTLCVRQLNGLPMLGERKDDAVNHAIERGNAALQS